MRFFRRHSDKKTFEQIYTARDIKDRTVTLHHRPSGEKLTVSLDEIEVQWDELPFVEGIHYMRGCKKAVLRGSIPEHQNNAPVVTPKKPGRSRRGGLRNES